MMIESAAVGLVPIFAIAPAAAVVIGIEIVIVVGLVGLIISGIQYLYLRNQFQQVTSVGIAHREPPLGSTGGTYAYRAGLIPATAGGAPPGGTILSFLVLLDPGVGLTALTTTTAGYTAVAPRSTGTTAIPAAVTASSSGPGANPVDLSFTAGGTDNSYTRRVGQVKIEFTFTLVFFWSAKGHVTYSEYVPGPYSATSGLTANTDLTADPP